ncbi:MAG TPA: hypothetical protein VJV75_07850, partial [Candidatus Polarisedimenticolia bacterium]|nr:hypothetical protein [Candidatus Polarisedimenticolia bacterium]
MRRRAAVPALIAAACLALGASAVTGQESPSYNLKEHTVNAAGHPEAATVMASAGYRITLDAVGDAIAPVGLVSASFQMDGGFAVAYPPPGEVTGLRFSADGASFSWDVETAAGTYNVYRDVISALPGGLNGLCFQSSVTTNLSADPQTPGTGWFYLVTSRNSLGEEGTKGFASSGVERANPGPCP